MNDYIGLKGLTDNLFITFFFKNLVYCFSEIINEFPLADKFIVKFNSRFLRHLIHKYALGIFISTMRQISPDFFSCKWHNRSNKSCNSAQNSVHNSLCRTSFNRFFLFTVKSVLDYIKIEVWHISNTEIVDAMESDMEIKFVISLLNLVDKTVKTHKCPLVNLCQFIIRNHICVRIETITIWNISKNKSCGISYLLVSVGKLF